MKGDPEFARAVLILASNEAAWQTFVRGLDQYRAASIQSLIVATPDEVHVAQGRARAITDILSVINDARQTANRHKT